MATTRKVSFVSRGLKVVGDLYFPPSTAPDRKRAAIIIAHPFTAVKEQSPALHAKMLAEAGFIALAFDAAFQGESEGEPRGLEDPYQRVEDNKCAVSFLSLLPEVDAERIGALGICAAGGYTAFASASDFRVKATACVSTVDAGRVTREGIWGTKAIVSSAAFEAAMKMSGEARTQYMKNGGTPMQLSLMPFQHSDNMSEDIPLSWRQASEYYRTPRCQHPRSTPEYPAYSSDMFATFDPFSFVDMISPRPLLMIAGREADTLLFSEDAVRRAREPKELFIVEGKGHVALYDQLEGHSEKLVSYMAEYLCA